MIPVLKLPCSNVAVTEVGSKMAGGRNPRRQRKKDTSLQEMGLRAIVLGLVFLITPAFLGASIVMKAVSSGLSVPGWLLLSSGLIMLALGYLKQKKASTAADRIHPLKPTAAKMTDREKKALVANIFRHTPRRANATPDIRFGRDPATSPDIQFGREVNASTVRPPSTFKAWSPSVFAAIEWRRFEAVCEALFAQAGFKTQSQPHGADGGVDIWLHSANAQGPVAIVQCKHWNGKAVGVKEIREFFGVMASHQLKRGTYATTSTYTVDAQKFAKDNGINALDGAALLSMIGTRTPEQQQALLAVAHEGEYWRPTCASCGIKLVKRTPAKDGTAFWGCSNYPRCKMRMQVAAT
jgi:restriction system protein